MILSDGHASVELADNIVTVSDKEIMIQDMDAATKDAMADLFHSCSGRARCWYIVGETNQYWFTRPSIRFHRIEDTWTCAFEYRKD